ncbi:MAG: hypothetical protein HS126_15095 [Anaerolineales bacterium]|nr:hypothetical protein [Anaerolineales bacterium]
MQSSQVSKLFDEFYQEHGFSPLPGSSLLHPSVPMSFVMSAGLVQIESILNGVDHLEGHQYTLTQKCFRYFDVSQVGYRNAHLSLFEMPGAFYFTNNGKATTIERMWQLVTQVLDVPAERLWVTYFTGGRVAGHTLEADQETYQTWLRLGLPPARLIGLGPDDNFWKQGGGIDGQEQYRKAGPNTEIFFDRGEQYSCGPTCRPGCSCGRFVEFANSLFVYNEIDKSTHQMRPLSTPFVETVIGAERLAMILQQKDSVFEIEAMVPLVNLVRQVYQPDNIHTQIPNLSENIIADHLRALVFLASDGAPPPGKDGRQRLVKILVRKILTHELLLNINSPAYRLHLAQIVAAQYCLFIDLFLDTFTGYFQQETLRFQQTLENGLRQFHQLIRCNKGDTLSGHQMVRLEKQFGVPIEIIEWQLRIVGLPFFNTEYEIALAHWRGLLVETNC